MHLGNLTDPGQLQDLNLAQLEKLAGEIRLFLIQTLSKTGGHLSSNLGIVELTLALHTVFHSPKDKLIFDVGHQAYVHKILTGRMDQFGSLRQYQGLCGFPKRCESEHDPWEPGHSSTSISAALGMAAARDILHEDYEVAAVIGDGALASGMALEALNDLGAQKRKMIVVFNDNNMSISSNPGGLERSITKLRTSGLYRTTKRDISNSLKDSEGGRRLLQVLKDGRDRLKHQMIPSPFFTQFDLDYIGPVDGHNLAELISALQTAKEHDGPVVVHVLTRKGKGYKFAEEDTNGDWHGVPPFDIHSGAFKTTKKPGFVSWSEIISNALCELAGRNPQIAAITPAMANGSKLQKFARLYPERFFDVGIAEEHAVTMAAGMAQAGMRPFVSIYSSFAQRAYDQMSHDACRMRLPVVFGIDRAGLVGEDGETHQGIYDISFMRTIPNLILSQPKDAREARSLLYTAMQQQMPFALRYPRGQARNTITAFEEIPVGSWNAYEKQDGKPFSAQDLKEKYRRRNSAETREEIRASVIAYGPDVDGILERAARGGYPVRVINARFFKPLDHEMLAFLYKEGKPVYVFEPDSEPGGLSEAIAAAFCTFQSESGNLEESGALLQGDAISCSSKARIEAEGKAQMPALHTLALKDVFVPHGSIPALRKAYHIDYDDLFSQLAWTRQKQE